MQRSMGLLRPVLLQPTTAAFRAPVWRSRGCAWQELAGPGKAAPVAVAPPMPVRLHDGAVRKLRSLREQNMPSVLQLTVNSGGCSGYSYEFRLVDQPSKEEGTHVVEKGTARLEVDEVSLAFLEDCEVDYVEEMIRSSFQVVKNKLADSKCGCGSSFNVAGF